MRLKEQLKSYLELRDLTASALARRSGVSKQTVSDWLAGRKPRDLDQVKKIAEVLGTTVDHLCWGSGTDFETKRATELDALMGDGWIGGTFEVRLRRVKKE